MSKRDLSISYVTHSSEHKLPLPSALEERWPRLGMLKFGDTKPDDADSNIDSPEIIQT